VSRGWTAERLRKFEESVKSAMENGLVRGPVHLSGGNESQLIEIFRDISRDDWVFSTYRSHYHALLHGLPEQYVMKEIMAGRSMSLHSQMHRFYTSAIVGGCLPIAVGLAAGIKRSQVGIHVWVFVGDMAASTGVFHDCHQYACTQELPITFVVEDNGFSTYTPTKEAWGTGNVYRNVRRYKYSATVPHIGATDKATI